MAQTVTVELVMPNRKMSKQKSLENKKKKKTKEKKN